jgi:all-trans-8'-apo-beta-carotenal 15,15'-oxygenase
VGFLSGSKSFTDSLKWNPALGSQWIVIEREGDAEPRRFETGPAWMWHALNAYERGGEVVAEFVGYENPDHFIGADPAAKAVMQGRAGSHAFPGQLRRVVLNLNTGAAREELLDGAGFEFPIVSPAVACHPHRYGYLVTETPGGWAWNGVARADMQTGTMDRFTFAATQYTGEAIFAPDPAGVADPAAGREPGWLLSEVYDADTQTSFLAVLDAEHVADGPVARVQLEHHVPLSFHGWWAENL